MITRFDHAVIAVRDLSAATRRYRALGFDAVPGGRHEGLGTHNAVIRFGLDYLELLSVYDEAEAGNRGLSGLELAALLREHDNVLAGYALATNDVEDSARRLRSAGVECPDPYPMHRLRPDGARLDWRLAVPGGVPWRRPWPFLIQWGTPDEERLATERAGDHPNGVRGLLGVRVLVRDLDRAIRLYSGGLGLGAPDVDFLPDLGASRATFAMSGFRIELLEPREDGVAGLTLASLGEGPLELLLAAGDPVLACRSLIDGGEDARVLYDLGQPALALRLNEPSPSR